MVLPFKILNIAQSARLVCFCGSENLFSIIETV